MSGDFPGIKSKHSLVAKHVTKERWDKVKDITTKTAGFTLAKACACAIQFDNQHCGIYAGDWDSYKDFAEVFDAIIQEYHGISADAKHTSDMDVEKIKGNVNDDVPVHSTRVRVGRSIDGFGLSPGITKEQRTGVESLMKSALAKLTGDLAIVSNNISIIQMVTFYFSQGCWHGARLARGPWHLPQRGQDLPAVGERGGPDEDHLHGEGR